MDSSDQATILLPQVQRYRIPALSLKEYAKQKGYIFCLTNVPLGAMIISIFYERSALYADPDVSLPPCMLRKVCSLCLYPLIFRMSA